MTLSTIFGLGGGEIILILIVALLLLGADKSPELVRGLREGMDELLDRWRGITSVSRMAPSASRR